MARQAQVEFIEDLLEKLGLSRDDLAAENPRWRSYESIWPAEASELLDWLQDYGKA